MGSKKTNVSSKKNQKKTVGGNESSDTKKVIWVFDNPDNDGEFSFDVTRNDFNAKEIFSKMLDYSKITWAEIKKQTHDKTNKSKHHFLEYEKLSPVAKQRFNLKYSSEYNDSIFSFALQNKLRIIGIRDKEFFHVTWFDPEHKFCPSHKKEK